MNLVYGFSLTPQALMSIGRLRYGEALNRITELRNYWRRNGVLFVDRDDRYRESMVRMVRASVQDQAVQTLLMEFLAGGLPVSRSPGFSFSDIPPARDASAPPGGSWFVEESEMQAWAEDRERPTVVTGGGVEVCRIDRFPQSRWACEPANSGNLDLDPGSSSAEVLALFKPLRGAFKTLKVIDAYCGKEEVANPGRSGLVKFLSSLVREDGESPCAIRTVEVYTAKDVSVRQGSRTRVSGDEIREAWTRIVTQLESPLVGIDLHLIPGSRFARGEHDRFVSFCTASGGICFQIGAGFGAFIGSRIRARCCISSHPVAVAEKAIRSLKEQKGYEFERLTVGGNVRPA